MVAAVVQAIDIGQPGVDLCHDLPRDAAIGALAERQHGVVGLQQLERFGLGKAAVAKRARDGRLYRIHRGVYAVGHPRLTVRGRWMAATMACGRSAALSHRSAAALWGILERRGRAAEVTVPSPGARARRGIDVHRSRTLTPTDVTVEDAIPCTTVARTLVDLGDVVDTRSLEQAVDQAEALRLFDLRAVEEVLARAGRRRGVGLLGAVLAELSAPAFTESEFEERFLALCRGASLPSPEVQAWIVFEDGTSFRADFLWRARSLVVETDGYAFHSSRGAFERDRRRDQRLKLAGYEVIRFTWREIADEPERVLGTVRVLLARLARP